MSNRTAIDLFAGCGGLTQGLKSAGFEVLGAVEIDHVAAASYELNHPDVRLWKSDIRSVEAEDILKELGLERGKLALLAGCPPCQGFSSMRTLNGARKVSDERNDLINDFVRLVEGLLPRAVMMENVPGLINDERLSAALRRMQTLGYFVDWENLNSTVRVLNAADYGVPQRRRRMILMTGRFGPVRFAIPAEDRVTVRVAIEKLPKPDVSTDPLHRTTGKRSERIEALIQAVPKDGGSRSELAANYRLRCHEDFDGFKDVYGRMAWDNVSPTITGGCINPSKGRFLHPEQDRAITLREAAMLQSFPSDYKFDLQHGKYAVAAQIGNALPPEFIRRQAIMIADYLNYPTTVKQ